MSASRPSAIARKEKILEGTRPGGRVGVVDIGSNTVRLVVYDAPTRLPIPIFNEKAQCALGSGMAKTGGPNVGVGTEKAEMPIIKRMASAAW